MEKYVLALDQGTTSSRAIFFDNSGKSCASAQYEFRQIFPHTGWVEHDPMEILSSQFRAVHDAMEKGEIRKDEICAIGITNQRETTIVWDRHTGKPVYNAIVWQCHRTADQVGRLLEQEPDLQDYIADRTGLIPDAYFSATKIAWILEHVEGARSRAERGELLFGTVDTWLIWNLTGGRVHVTDYSNAARTMLFDIKRLCWDERMLQTLNIPRGMLPQVMPSSSVYGKVAPGIAGLEELAGVPIASAIGDQQSALFGQACFEKGQAKNTYGTGCFLVMNTGDELFHSKNQLLTTIAWGLNGKVEYALEGSVFNGGSVIKWMRDELGMIRTADEINDLAERVTDTAGAYLVPAFTGLGAPYWDMYARGTMIGLTRGFNRFHFARMVLESIAFQVTDLIRAMESDVGSAMTDLRVDGGASASNTLLQMQADILGCCITRPRNIETTAMGASYLAGLATGFFNSREQIKRNWECDRQFAPVTDLQERSAKYRQWQHAVAHARNWIKPDND